MELNFRRITNAEFIALNSTCLFGSPHVDRAFGCFSLNDFEFKFGWQSDLIDPQILSCGQNHVLIGVDLNCVIVDSVGGRVILNLNLDFFFFEAKYFARQLFVITELEVIVLDYETFQILEKILLPDIFKGIEFASDLIKIHCVGGGIIVRKPGISAQ